MEVLYGFLAVVLLIGIIFVVAVCAELKHENKSYIGRINYLEDLLKRK